MSIFKLSIHVWDKKDVRNGWHYGQGRNLHAFLENMDCNQCIIQFRMEEPDRVKSGRINRGLYQTAAEDGSRFFPS